MSQPIFYRPEMSVPDLDSASPSAGKPAAFVELVRSQRRPSRLKTFRPATPKDLYLVHDKAFVD